MRYAIVTRNGEFVLVPEFRIQPGERGSQTFSGLPMNVDVDWTSFASLGEDGVMYRCQVKMFSFRGQKGVVLSSNQSMTPEEATVTIVGAGGEATHDLGNLSGMFEPNIPKFA